MNEIQQILDTVNSFYSDAYNQLIIYTVGLFAFLGTAVPSVLSWLSNRSIRKNNEDLKLKTIEETKKLEVELTNRIDRIFERKEEELLAFIEEKATETNASLSRESSRSQAGIYHVQASLNAANRHHLYAFKSAIVSASFYVKGGDEHNMQNVLTIAQNALPELSDSMLSEDKDVDFFFDKLIEDLKSINGSSRYTNLIRDLETAFHAAKAR